jgi:hypothetical protein
MHLRSKESIAACSMNLLIFSNKSDRDAHSLTAIEIWDAFSMATFDHPWAVLCGTVIAVVSIMAWARWLMRLDILDRNEDTARAVKSNRAQHAKPGQD